MTFHLFGNLITSLGTAANNRGENEGNITTLQKILWRGEVHTTVSAEAIRWALRYHWQTNGNDNEFNEVNRQWNDESNDNEWQGDFDPKKYIDDDVLGYMKAEAAKSEATENQTNSGDQTDAGQSKKGKKKKEEKAKGTNITRRGVLEVTRAVSTTPYQGDITFNSTSGQKGRTSLYGAECHATRYQYGFAMTPSRLKEPERTLAVLDGLISLGEVGGNHSRFLYDFSPDSLVLRWTHDFSPRFLYCFDEDEEGEISCPQLVRRVSVRDIDPSELWIAGTITESEEAEELKKAGAKVYPGIKAALKDFKETVQADLEALA